MFKRKEIPAVQPESPKYIPLTGVDTDRLLENYESNLSSAEARRQAILDEIQRLQVELHKTEVAISAMGSAAMILKKDSVPYEDALDRIENEINNLLDNTDMESSE